MKYIIKISPEISIKSKPVRKRTILMLKNNIKRHLSFYNISCQLSWTWDIINLESKNEKTLEILKKIPWILKILEVETFLLPDEENEIFDYIFEKAKEYYLDKIDNKTFVVRVKRSGNHNFRSIDLERYIWGWLYKFSNNSKVQLKDPEITVKIDVKDKNFSIIKNIEYWIWGYPVWFQGKVISLISWWFDSWVSTYSMIKRWCQVDYLFFNLWWTAHEMWVKQVSYYLWKNFWVAHKDARFICINFEEIIKELLTKVNHRFRWVLLKRFMLRIASMVAENYYYAIVKWDSLWQVSSQTLKNMSVIDKASDQLVLRPLISLDKQEIINTSMQIWTYNFACNMPEYCWVISDKPATWAKLEDILKEEENIWKDVLLRAFENKKIEFVKNMMEKYNSWETEELEVSFFLEPEDIVIDIREDSFKKSNPLVLDKNINILEIPFYDLNSKFPKLDQSKTYLLYCEKWVLSNVHWLYLKEKWFNNIKVYRLIEKDKDCNINIIWNI